MGYYDTVRRHWEDRRVSVHGDVSEAAFEAFADELVAVARAAPDDDVLDVGCGDGQLAALVRPHVRRVDGFDIAPHRVENAARAVPDGRFWVQSFLAPVPRSGYGLVVSWSVVQYCRPAEVDILIERSLAAVRPGGRVVHGDVVDRGKLRELMLRPLRPKGVLAFAYAKARPDRPIWRDGTHAHDVKGIARRWSARGHEVAVVAARCAYRSHLVVEATAGRLAT